MKIKVLDRILLTLYTITILVFSVFLIGLSVGGIELKVLTSFVSSLTYNWIFIVVTLLIGLVFAIVSLKLLTLGLVKDKSKSSTIKVTDLGTIRVSLVALDNLVHKAVRGFDEVKDLRTSIIPDNEGIKIGLNIILMPDVVMPEITKNIQDKVKEYVESLSGVLVKEVQVEIADLFNGQRTKVK